MKVLVAEDDPVTAHLLEVTLNQWGYDPCVTEDGEQALAVLQADSSIKLILTDWQMPKKDGLQLIRELKSDQENLYYVILLTSKNTTESVVEGLEAGADDFIAKPFMSEELRVRVRAGARILDQERRLHYNANYDELTGIWNRRMILSMVEKEWQRAHREQLRLALLMLDLDKFKSINDNHGHDAGDTVLKHFSRVVGNAIRPYDLFGRYGGEEFLLLMPLTEEADLHKAGERIRKAVNEARFVINDKTTLPVTVSVGISEKGDSSCTLRDLINHADQAMYQAKRSGGNAVVVYSHDQEDDQDDL